MFACPRSFIRATAPSSGGCRQSLAEFLPYLLSFTVLGLRWLASIEVRSRAEYYKRAYVNSWLFYLLLITCVPFSTIVVGPYALISGPSRWARCCWFFPRC
jgi:uncharacterized membrane protein